MGDWRIADLFEKVINSNQTSIRTTNQYIDYTFHDADTSISNGNAFEVGAYKTLTLEIYGTSSTRTVTFYGKSKSGTLRPIQGVRMSDFATATSTTTNNEIWQFDITGLDYVVMDLTAVSGGNVSVKGRAVA